MPLMVALHRMVDGSLPTFVRMVCLPKLAEKEQVKPWQTTRG